MNRGGTDASVIFQKFLFSCCKNRIRKKYMDPESVCQNLVQSVTHTTPDLLRNSAHLSGFCCGEHPRKTALECINPAKTLTVREAIFRRESVPLSMHGCMESMSIKQHTFCARPCTTVHFCCASTDIGSFEGPEERGQGLLSSLIG